MIRRPPRSTRTATLCPYTTRFRSSPAAMGEETEAFHVALAKNFYESYEWGRLRPGVGIGGQLITARIDRDGIAVRRTYDFPPLRGRSERYERASSAPSEADEDLPRSGRPNPPGGGSEERRVGKAWVSTCRCRWSPST